MKIVVDKNFAYLSNSYKQGEEISVEDKLGHRWIRNGIAHAVYVPPIKIERKDKTKPIIGFVTLQNIERDEVANTRFRVTWALPYMPNSFVSEDYEELRQADVVVFQSRHLVSDLKMAEKLKADGVRLIWDFTDPHWIKPYDPHAVHPIFYTIANLTDLATFCTEGLESTYKQLFPNVKTAIVKDRINLNLYPISKLHEENKKELKIAWHGSYGNICSIDLARADLEKLAKEIKIKLICVYDKINQYPVKPINGVTIESRLWSNEAVTSALLESDISINPKYPYPHWKSYKSDNKTMASWACGVPCSEGNFYNEIKAYLDYTVRNSISGSMLKYVTLNYDVKLTANEWHTIADKLPRKKNKIVVYTAISGDKYQDTLRENQYYDGTADFIAYLDNTPKSKTWETRKIFKQFIDPSRQAKIYKVLPWQYFPDYEYSIWMDGCVSIKVSPKTLIETYLKDADIAMFKHHARDDIYEEYKADLPWLHRKLEPNCLFAMQMDKYRKLGFPEHSGLNECTIILRRHTEPVKRMCEEWWSEITAYTVADQCSFAYVLRKHNLKVNHIPGTVLNNKFFERGKREYTKS